MNRKRLVIGIGLVAAGFGFGACVRHCRRVMHGQADGQDCPPADCPCGSAGVDEERDEEEPAIAA